MSATREGTARFAARFATRFADGFFRTLETPDARLTVGSLGVGTFLGECTDTDDTRYEETLHAAFVAGCNVVDTAISYRCQRSERAVGRALARGIADGTVRRDEVVVCTKGGFVAPDGEPPASREAYDAYLERELFAPGLVTVDEVAHGGHSLAPAFLAHQIARSRANLGVDTIDLYSLHEPERQLDVLDPDAFARTLRRAIEALEGAVGRGEIARWGIATWRGLRVPPGAAGHLSLASVVAAARDVAGARHHFAAAQLPVSLATPEAARVPTQPLPGRPQSRLVPLLHAAQELGVPILASAPLMHGQLAANLPPQVREALPGCSTDAQRAVSFVRALPGVCVTFAGMRSAEHVHENLRVAR